MKVLMMLLVGAMVFHSPGARSAALSGLWIVQSKTMPKSTGGRLGGGTAIGRPRRGPWRAAGRFSRLVQGVTRGCAPCALHGAPMA
jgi:hypothetical protein